MSDVNQRELQRRLSEFSFLLAVSEAKFAENTRAGAKNALIASAVFIRAVFPNGNDLARPLSVLLHALEDLDSGHVGALVKPAELNGGRTLAFEVELQRADAAALMELYRKAGMPNSQAADQTARSLNRLGFRDDKSRITAKRVKYWRNQLKAHRNSTGAKRYAAVLRVVADHYPTEPSEAPKILINLLPDLHAMSIPNDSPSQ